MPEEAPASEPVVDIVEVSPGVWMVIIVHQTEHGEVVMIFGPKAADDYAKAIRRKAAKAALLWGRAN